MPPPVWKLTAPPEAPQFGVVAAPTGVRFGRQLRSLAVELEAARTNLASNIKGVILRCSGRPNKCGRGFESLSLRHDGCARLNV
jgi:hypothetical protein